MTLSNVDVMDDMPIFCKPGSHKSVIRWKKADDTLEGIWKAWCYPFLLLYRQKPIAKGTNARYVLKTPSQRPLKMVNLERGWYALPKIEFPSFSGTESHPPNSAFEPCATNVAVTTCSGDRLQRPENISTLIASNTNFSWSVRPKQSFNQWDRNPAEPRERPVPPSEACCALSRIDIIQFNGPTWTVWKIRATGKRRLGVGSVIYVCVLRDFNLISFVYSAPKLLPCSSISFIMGRGPI